MTTTVRIETELQGFTVPNFVVPVARPGSRDDGIFTARGIPLAELDAETLSALCDLYRAEVFKKAGKPDPRLVP